MDSISENIKKFDSETSTHLKNRFRLHDKFSRARFPSFGGNYLGHRRECRVCGECKKLDQFPVGRSDLSEILLDRIRYRNIVVNYEKVAKYLPHDENAKHATKSNHCLNFLLFVMNVNLCRQAWVANYWQTKRENSNNKYIRCLLFLFLLLPPRWLLRGGRSPLSPISSSSLSSSSTDNDIASSLRLPSRFRCSSCS